MANIRSDVHGRTRGSTGTGGRTERDLHGFLASISSSTAAASTAETLAKMTRRYEDTGRGFSSAASHSRMCSGRNESIGRVPRYGNACRRRWTPTVVRVVGSVVCEASHFSPYWRNVIRLAAGSMYCPRDMSASIAESHLSCLRPAPARPPAARLTAWVAAGGLPLNPQHGNRHMACVARSAADRSQDLGTKDASGERERSCVPSVGRRYARALQRRTPTVTDDGRVRRPNHRKRAGGEQLLPRYGSGRRGRSARCQSRWGQ